MTIFFSNNCPAPQSKALPSAENGLSGFAKLTLESCLAAFFVAQTYLTIIDENRWPLSSHNFFAFIPAEPVVTLSVRVGNRDGKWTQYSHPGSVMRIEFFRANQVLMKFGIINSEKRSMLCHILLNNLNDQKWRAFD